MTRGFQTLVVGGGMITADLLLPCLYHLQRLHAISEITVCSLSTGPLRALADNREIREAFPDSSFIAQPPFSEPPESSHPDLFERLISEMRHGTARRDRRAGPDALSHGHARPSR